MPPDTTPLLYSWGTAREEKEKKRQKQSQQGSAPKNSAGTSNAPTYWPLIISPPTKEQRIQLQWVCKAYMSVNPVEPQVTCIEVHLQEKVERQISFNNSSSKTFTWWRLCIPCKQIKQHGWVLYRSISKCKDTWSQVPSYFKAQSHICAKTKYMLLK